ncbi:DUF1223 domain-containing protein [Terasakiella pusilla]|uniref:DUF1223 domain-containing protein n=1 Tax=Terasakiella pusilla TaxID=64973 RepID=UPI00048AB183|nr:DUF1223 domain-containing protein [Terasakiella pusilla]
MKKLIVTSVLSLLLTTAPVSADEPLAVVELFTSQGCSSCPPADAFLGELSMRQDVLALAYHVDYWDYIGWKDIYADSAFTQRQRDYAHTFDLRYVYTPQMVVNGTTETSGNERRKIVGAIEENLKRSTDVQFRASDHQVEIDGPAQDQAVAIYQVTYLKEEKTVVRRGENRGKILSEYNIVTDLVELSEWRGGRYVFSLEDDLEDESSSRALFLQRKGDLKIIAALKL